MPVIGGNVSVAPIPATAGNVIVPPVALTVALVAADAEGGCAICDLDATPMAGVLLPPHPANKSAAPIKNAAPYLTIKRMVGRFPRVAQRASLRMLSRRIRITTKKKARDRNNDAGFFNWWR